PNGKFHATKCIGGKRHYQEFEKLTDAKKWRREFHPLLDHKVTANRIIPTASDQSNGKDKFITFGEVLEKYQKSFLRSLEPYTQYKKMQRLSKFAPNLVSVPMSCMAPEVISNHIEMMLLLVEDKSRRCNFDK